MTTPEIELTPGWIAVQRDADLVLWLTEDVPMFFRRIEPGEFQMGSRYGGSTEQPVHRVIIPHAFYMGAFPVTQHQWRATAERDPTRNLTPSPSYFTRAQDLHQALRPVEQVSWDDVRRWCEVALATFDRVERRGPEGEAHAEPREVIAELRLPWEAEWEYACRAGESTEYHAGQGEGALRSVGWLGESWEKGGTHPVGSAPRGANNWGLFDMHGNVWEWCEDEWDEAAYVKRADGWVAEQPKLSPARAAASAWRVMRGGSYSVSAVVCRSAFRGWWGPVIRGRVLGFRVCLLPGPSCPSQQAAASAGGTGRGSRRPSRP